MTTRTTTPYRPDPARIALVARTWDADARRELIAVRLPSGSDPATAYRVTGHSDGRATGCDCPAGAHGRPCKHAAYFAIAIAEAERRHYDDYSTDGLLALLAYYDHQHAGPLDDDQRLRRGGVAAQLAARGVDCRTGRTLAERNRVVARGEAAKADLFGDAI